MSIMENMATFIQNLTADLPDENVASDEELLVIDIEEEEVSDEIEDNDHWDAIHKVAEWFARDEEAQEPYRDEMNEAYKLWSGRHWDLTGYNGLPLRTEAQQQSRPNSVENITFALVEGLVSEFAQEMDIVDFPVDENDEEVATIMTDLKRFIANKNRIKNERQNFVRWFFLYGTGIWHVYWDEEWSGGRGPNRWKGDIRWKALHPNCFFPDARCRESVDDGIRVHKAIWQPIEHVRKRYPDADILPDTVDPSDFIGDELEEVGSGEELHDQVRVVETWYIGEPLILGPGEESQGDGLHIIWWVEGQNKYLNHANYVMFEPGETPTFSSAFIVKQCYPREGNIFGYGEPFFFKQIQIIRNKTAELILEGHLHHAIGQTFYNEGALTPSQKKAVEQKGTIPGWWFPVQDIMLIRREFGAGVPASLLNELDRLQKMAEMVVGRFDISQGRTPGSVTAFRALDLLNTRAQIRLRSKEESIASSYEEVGASINRLIDICYDTERSYRIIGNEDTRKWGRYDPEEHKRVYFYATNESMSLRDFRQRYPQAFDDVSGVAQGEGAPIEGQDFEIYSPELDVTCKVSTTLPSDRLFYMEMAKELYGGNLIDEEIFWYVMEHGKFPPFEEMRQKIIERQKMEQQMMMLQQMQGIQGQQPQLNIQPQQGAMPNQVPAQEQTPPPTADEVIGLMPEEAKVWYEQQPPEIQQAFIEEIEQAMGGEMQQPSIYPDEG